MELFFETGNQDLVDRDGMECLLCNRVEITTETTKPCCVDKFSVLFYGFGGGVSCRPLKSHRKRVCRQSEAGESDSRAN